MTEELPLPPDVRATQADALNALGLQWQCSYEHCKNPGLGAGKATCCDGTLVLCKVHMAQYLSLIIRAGRTRMSLPCMHCGHVYHWPNTTPSSFYSYSFPLDKAGTA